MQISLSHPLVWVSINFTQLSVEFLMFQFLKLAICCTQETVTCKTERGHVSSTPGTRVEGSKIHWH